MDGASALERSEQSPPRSGMSLFDGGCPMRFAGESWSRTADAFGWTPLLAEDPPSPSPFPTPPAPSPRESEDTAAKPAVPIILLVEDNSSDVYVIRQVLKHSGLAAKLQVVSDGEEAISTIQKIEEAGSRQLPSIVLLDWNLPRASGAEVLSELRKSEQWRHIPVVVVTSTSSPQEIAEMHRLGVAGHFRKPTNLDAYLTLGDLIRLTLTEAPEE